MRRRKRRIVPIVRRDLSPVARYINRFSSWGAAIDFATSEPKTTLYSETKSRRESRDFYGHLSWPQALDMAHGGWAEGADRLVDLSRSVTADLGSLIERHHIVYDVEGMECDVATALSGVPEFMMRWDTEIVQSDQESRIFRIAVNPGASYGIKTATIEQRGSVILSLISLLEMSGIRAEVELVFNSGEGHTNFFIPIKAPDQHLDMPRLAFALCHPAMLRRIIFSMMEQYPLDFPEAYGYPTDIRVDCDLYMPCMYSGSEECDWTDPAAVKLWLVDKLQEQGVHFHAEK